MFEGKIQNNSKAVAFTRNHTDDNDEDGTKNNMSPPGRGQHNYKINNLIKTSLFDNYYVWCFQATMIMIMFGVFRLP